MRILVFFCPFSQGAVPFIQQQLLLREPLQPELQLLLLQQVLQRQP